MGARPISTGSSLRLGFSEAVSLWPAALLVFLTLAAEVVGGLVASFAALFWLVGEAHVGQAALGGAITASLGARILRTVVEGGALLQAKERLRRRAAAPLWRAMLGGASRALRYLLWLAPLEALAAGWRWLAIIATVWAYGSALASGEHGALASAALALLLALSLPLALAWSSWRRLGFVRTVGRDEGALASLHDAAGALWRRPWPFVVVVLVTGALALAAELTLSSFVNAVAQPAPDALPSFELALAGQLVAGVLVAFVAALLELSALQAFLALDLGERGELPEPPRPPPIAALPAEPILQALPAEPAP